MSLHDLAYVMFIRPLTKIDVSPDVILTDKFSMQSIGCGLSNELVIVEVNLVHNTSS
jgi:hypothetical protein